ncbi:MAG: hypothetical protein R6X02_05145 [Enhygromyxa sp.]
MVELGGGVRLVAMSVAWVDGYADGSSSTYLTVGVGAEGLVAAWFKTSARKQTYRVDIRRPTSADLHDISSAGGEFTAVGAGGVILQSADAIEWAPVEVPGLDADLWSVTPVRVGSAWWLTVIGDGVLMVRDDEGVWHEPPAPADGWGQLRALFYDSSGYVVVGLAGVAWSATELVGEWKGEATGVEADLTTAAFGSCAAGPGGTLVCREFDGWQVIETGVDVDFVDASASRVLTADGRVYTLDDDRVLELVAEYDGTFSALSDVDSKLRLARDGEVVIYDREACTRFE